MDTEFITGRPLVRHCSETTASRAWRVNDIVIAYGYAYKVVGVYLGAVGAVNMIGLKCLSEKKGNAGGCDVEEMLVPERILLKAIKGGASHTRDVI